MIKRELKINLKNLLIWLAIILFLFMLVFIVYPSIIDSQNKELLNEMMRAFPEDLLKAFNMDIVTIDSAFGWWKSEGMVLLLIVGSAYSALLGGSILIKEESDKTIEFLYSKPVIKNQIITSKIISGVVNIAFLVIIVTIFNLIGLSFLEEYDIALFLKLSISTLLIYYIFFFGSLFVSTFFKKSRTMVGISLGLVFLNYFLQTIGSMSEKYDFIKYFSVFEVAPSRDIIQNGYLSWSRILVGFVIIGCIVLTYINYNKKEFD